MRHELLMGAGMAQGGRSWREHEVFSRTDNFGVFIFAVNHMIKMYI